MSIEENLMRVQTPQVVKAKMYIELLKKIDPKDPTLTDEGSIAQSLGYKPYFINGQLYDIKITDIETLETCEAIRAYKKRKK